MDEDKKVPMIVFESCMVRMERTIRRLVVCLVLAILLICASNLAWLYEWNQYDYVGDTTSKTYEQDGTGTNVIGNDNEVKHEPETNN